MRKFFLIFLAAAVTVATAVCCKPRGSSSAAPDQSKPLRHEFPAPVIPSVLTTEQERLEYMVEKYWTKFLAEEGSYRTDSLYTGGLPGEVFEKALGTYLTMLEMMPVEKASGYVSSLFDAVSGTGVFVPFSKQMARYLYDPNSPVRSEDLWLPYVTGLSRSEVLSDEERHAFEFEKEMCSLNRSGTVATDFSFMDSRGRERTLHGIKAEFTLLIFGNPGCHACRLLVEDMAADGRISSLISSGRLVVADIYIDDEIDEWKAHIHDYPSEWINGYDHNYVIRRDNVYNVRALPTIYLLDMDKRVMLKDPVPERLLSTLASLAL